MKFPRPDGVSMINGQIILSYEDHDERDIAYDWLEAHGAGDITLNGTSSELDRLRKLIAEKDAALDVFAEFADHIDDEREIPDDCGVYAFKGGDFRRARTARYKS